MGLRGGRRGDGVAQKTRECEGEDAAGVEDAEVCESAEV